MLKKEIYEGPIEVQTHLHRVEIYMDSNGGGRIRFNTLQQCCKDGVPFGVGNMEMFEADLGEVETGCDVMESIKCLAQAIMDSRHNSV